MKGRNMGREELWKHVEGFISSCFEPEESERERYTRRNVGYYRSFEVQLTNSIGRFCNYPWIVFLKGENRVQKGIYPGILCFSREYDDRQGQCPLKVEILYGIAGAEPPVKNWRESSLKNKPETKSKGRNVGECRVEAEFSGKSIEDFDKKKDVMLDSLDRVIDEFEGT